MSLPAFKSNPTLDERQFQDRIVQLISIEKRPEDALELLSQHYRVEMPALRIGLPPGEKRALGCYVNREKTIYISNQEYLYNPYELIHKFYHNLRIFAGNNPGTENNAKELVHL